MFALKTVAILASVASAAAVVADVAPDAKVAPYVNSQTSYTFLYQNTLNLSDNYAHGGAIMLDAMNYFDASAACQVIGETLLTKTQLQQFKADYTALLGYVEYSGYVPSTNQMFWIQDNVVAANEGSSSFSFFKPTKYASSSFPVLCTQAQGVSNYGGSATKGNSLTVAGEDGNSYIGFRNQKSFRFQGLRYATFPGRFQYTTPFTGNNSVVNATQYGQQCKQYGSGSEDCFFLNIFTPYIPKANSKKNLRPVHFWIHGGGFTGGAGSGYDASDLASREDIITVTINYRLGNAGFLAVPGVLPGNYGIGDQITALDWVIANIANFGGDPNQITIAGQSAGAGSVRVLLGSPKAIGKFQGAIAMSNLGGGYSLGLQGNYGSTYSSYLTITQSYQQSGVQAEFLAAGCNQTTLAAQVACLRTSTYDISGGPGTARYVVQDGSIVTTEELTVSQPGPSPTVAQIPVIFGTAENDGGAIGSGYSLTCKTELQCIMQNLYISQAYAQSVIDSGLFPLYSTSTNGSTIASDSFNVTQRIATDITFRCVDQATMYAASQTKAFAKSYYYQSDRGFPGDAYNPNNVNIYGTKSPQFPNGDPSTFYYKVHSSDLPSLFGQYYPPRANSDILSMQLTTGYFGAFIRTGNPNPPIPMLKVRKYTATLQAVQQTGPWNEVNSLTGPMKILDYPAKTAQFTDIKQCTFLNISTSYYLQGGM